MKADPSIIAKLADHPDALTAYLAACDTVEDKPQTAPKRAGRSSARSAIAEQGSEQASAKVKRDRENIGRAKRSTAKRAPAAPKASSARTRKPKAVPEVWTVDPAWKGQPASQKMVAAALYWGVPVATCSKLQKDKLALSLAIAAKRGIPVG